jgi:hypothetical protein
VPPRGGGFCLKHEFRLSHLTENRQSKGEVTLPRRVGEECSSAGANSLSMFRIVEGLALFD